MDNAKILTTTDYHIEVSRDSIFLDEFEKDIIHGRVICNSVELYQTFATFPDIPHLRI